MSDQPKVRHSLTERQVPNQFSLDFGRRLTVSMHDAGVSPAGLARALEVSKPTVTDWRKGRYLPSAYHLACLCRVLPCDPSYLLSLDDDKPAPEPRRAA